MSATSTAFPRTESRRWVHFINDDFFDRPDLDPGLEHLALRFERFARDQPWFVTSNQELMEELDCSKNTLAALLRQGEALGWFRRVLITAQNGHATGRLGIVLFVRPTSRPVATNETFEQITDQIRAATCRRKPPTPTLPFTPAAPQKLGMPVPKNWAPPLPKNWVPPTNKEIATERKTEKTTTTTLNSNAQTPIHIHAPSESSSSLASLSQEPETQPDSSAVAQPITIVPAPSIPTVEAPTQPIIETGAPIVTLPSPATPAERAAMTPAPTKAPSPPAAAHPHVEIIEVTPTVPAQVLALPTGGIDQALLMALVARVVRFSAGFKVGANWTSEQARAAILSLLRAFGCPLWWISNALDHAERRANAWSGKKPVEGWGFIRQIVANWTQGDGTPGSPPGVKPASPPGPPCPVAESGDRTPIRSPPRSSIAAIEAELPDLSAEELRGRIADLEATLANLSPSPRLRMGEQLRNQLSQAQSLLAAREVGS
jgi:hypothetical protein